MLNKNVFKMISNVESNMLINKNINILFLDNVDQKSLISISILVFLEFFVWYKFFSIFGKAKHR